ncbi:magnesium transporter CorA family protein [Candidatus Saccharibacteria bacterium]|nr:MAG: magnesium transporter CorA family protein [Candidatus Saccharibacteria bacterium]
MNSVRNLESAESSFWVHAEAPDDHEIDVLCSEYGLAERFVHDALDRDEIPRVETVGDFTYIITRFAYETDAGDIETAPILFALNQAKLLTVSLEKLPSLQEILAERNLEQNSADPVYIMLLVLLHIDAQYDRFIHDSSKQIHRLLSNIGKRALGPDSFVRFVHIEDDMNDFLSSLGPTNTTLRHLLTNKDIPSFSHHRDLVNTVILNNEQSIQTCESNLKSLVSIRRTYTLISSHSLDRTIKILTMVSVFISIPTMFFSMYGMNIGLPHAQNPKTFLGLLVICLITVLTAYVIGRKKRIF